MRLHVPAVRVAWGLWAVSTMMGCAAIILALVPHGGIAGAPWEDVLLATLFPTLGALVVSRRSSRAMGWLFLVIGLFAQVNAFSTVYANDAFRLGVHLRGAVAAVWLAAWSWAPALAGFILLMPLLFPTGRPMSARWSRVMAAEGILISGGVLLLGLLPFSVTQSQLLFRGLHNPVGVPELGRHEELLGFVFGIGTLLALIASVSALVLRFRRARGEERQQMKWFVYSMCLFAVTIVLATLSSQDWITMLGLLILLSALCVSVLRYRLYEIDRIINRTVVYSVATTVLAGTYLGLVLLFQLILPLGTHSPVVVAVSTLVVAAAFGPVRRRVQGFVDRKFDRARYDAARTLEQFSTRLSEHIDLDSLGSSLVAVVDSTMRPAMVSLWLKEEGR